MPTMNGIEPPPHVLSDGTPIDSRLRGRDMLCFSHDWTGDPLSKTHLMRLLAKENRILWVNSIGYRTPTVSGADLSRIAKKLAAATQPIKEVEPNLFVLNPLAVPAYGRPSVRAFNRRFLRWQVQRAMRRLNFQRVINWVFNPAAAIIAGQLGEEQLIYYCVDEYTAFSGVASSALAEMETKLLKQSDLVIVSAERLYQSKAPHNPNTVLVQHGVDFQHFRKACTGEVKPPAEQANLPRPILGFFGLVADWVDVDLMAEMARRFPEGSLVIVGKVSTDVSKLEALPNVHFFGRKPYADLPAYCAGWDVSLMPFRINELTLNSNPLKVREYLAAGLPVISTPIPEVEVLNLCRIAADADEFEREIRDALKDPGPTIERSDQIRHESWEARLREIEQHLSEVKHAPAKEGVR